MDRQIVYSSQVPQTTDLLNTNKQTMIALAKLCADLFGTATMATGLACVPTAPASMSVNVNPGQIYQLANVDGTAYSAIIADTTHSIVKQGILMDAQSFAITAPSTAGYSQNYLIQATYLDTDTNNSVLPYYNSANPTQALNGPSGNGTSQPTTRAGQVSLQLVAGTAAATGSQTTPAVTTGYVGLWVITVANGQSTITSSNIAQYAGAPILPSSILASVQNGNLSYAVATGTANAHTIALTPALTARVDGMPIRYKAPAANMGAVTLADGVGTANVLGGNHSALQGGEYAANGIATVVWDSSVSGGSYILEECTGGAVQVAPATKSQHAVQLGQVAAKNGAINPRFSVNQRGYVSGTATASGTYMMDRWKSSLANSSLTFTAAAQGQQVTVAGQVLQIIEQADIIAGQYTLSWVGSAQARVYNVGASAPAFASSPITVMLDGTANVNLEFNAGTLDQVNFVPGAVPFPFQPRFFEDELRKCQRYFEKGYNLTQAPGNTYSAGTGPYQFGGVSGANIYGSVSFKVSKRAIPSMGFYDAAGSSSHASYYNGTWNNGLTVGSASAGQQSFTLIASNTGTTAVDFQWTADADL